MKKNLRNGFQDRLQQIRNADLKHMYEVQLYTIRSLAILFKCHAGVIRNTLKEKGVTLRTRGGGRTSEATSIDINLLKDLYENKNYSINHLASRFKVNPAVLSKHMKQSGIAVKRGGRPHKYLERIAEINIKEAVYLYEVKRYNVNDLSRHFKINSVSMSRFLSDKGVKLRGGGKNRDQDFEDAPGKKDGLNYYERLIY